MHRRYPVNFSYNLAGLLVDSEIKLPVPETPRDPSSHSDLCFQLAKQRPKDIEELVTDCENRQIKPLALIQEPDGTVGFSLYQLDEAALLVWHHMDIAFFVDSQAEWVDVVYTTAMSRAHAPWLLLGSVLAHVLHAKGRLCLHGSAVHNGRRSIALIGTNRRGKSTLTAFLLKHGWSLITDDLLCVENLDTLTVRPCFPLIKLGLESIEFLGLENSRRTPVPLPEIMPPEQREFRQKDKVDVDGSWGSFTDRSHTTIDAVYHVHRRGDTRGAGDSDVRISSLDPDLAVASMISNGYSGGMLSNADRKTFIERAEHFASRTPIHVLSYASGLDNLIHVSRSLVRNQV